jgi:peptidyl-Lys metalloendopeptidase
VTGVSNLKVTTTVTNTGDEMLTLLKDPRGVLDTFPAESFAIQHETSGVSPGFIGARVSLFVLGTIAQR